MRLGMSNVVQSACRKARLAELRSAGQPRAAVPTWAVVGMTKLQTFILAADVGPIPLKPKVGLERATDEASLSSTAGGGCHYVGGGGNR